MGRVTGVRRLAGAMAMAAGMLAGLPGAIAQPRGAELGNNLFIVTHLAQSSSYTTSEISGPNRTFSVWDGDRFGDSTVAHSGLRLDVEAMQRAIAACDEAALTRAKLSALEFLEYLAVTKPVLAARMAQYVRAVRMICGGRTYTAGETSEGVRRYFTETFGPIIRRIDEAIKTREAKQPAAAQTASPPIESILDEIEEERAALRQQKKPPTNPPQVRKESKLKGDKPQVKKLVNVTGGQSAKIDRKTAPTDIRKLTQPSSRIDVTKLKPQQPTGASATIRGVEEEKKKRAAAVEEARLEAIGGLQHSASVMLAELQQVKGPCISPADRQRMIARVTARLAILTLPGRLSPGMEQLHQAIDAEIARIRAIPDCPSSAFNLSVNGGYGQISRPDFGSMLQLETGGVIINRNFGAADRTDSFQGFGVSGSVGLDLGRVRSFIFGYNFGHTSSDANSAMLSTGGNDLNILSPQGPAGGLGGGISVPGVGGFADVTGLHYDDSYDEHLLYLGVLMASWFVPQTGAQVTPSVKALFGYVRETSDYSGTTAAGGENFAYSSKLETTRYGLAGGLDIVQPLSGAYGLYLNSEVRVIENHTSADSTLTASGILNASEGAHTSANKLDLGGKIGGGFYFQTGNVTVKAGASYETWQVPTLKFSESAPVSIDYGARESIAATLTATVRFP